MRCFLIVFGVILTLNAQAQVGSGAGIPLEFQVGGTTYVSITTSGTLEVSSSIKIGGDSATCSSANEGATRYNATDKKIEFCNATAWTSFVVTQATPAPTAPAGSGYFVLSSAAKNGNFGGWPAGANATCLSDLTTNTSWKGYATALANGQLVSSKVVALLCVNPSGCTNLMPVTTYYFAHAGDATAGGASFTTDATGRGPQDAASWAAANYFSGSFSYWMNRSTSSATLWSNTFYNPSCNSWADGTSGQSSYLGSSSNTDNKRWITSNATCEKTYYYICAVNP